MNHRFKFSQHYTSQDGILNVYHHMDGDTFKVVIESIRKKHTSFLSLRSLFKNADDSIPFVAKDMAEENEYCADAYEFALPNDNIGQVTCFLRFLQEVVKLAGIDPRTHERSYSRIQVSEQSLFPLLQSATGAVNQQFSITRTIANAYINACNATELAQVLGDDITICYFPKRIISVFLNEDISLLSTPEVSLQHRKELAERIFQKLLETQTLTHMQCLLTHVQQSFVSQLVIPAYGKLAHDGMRYSADYTEFDFLRAAVFRLNEHGCVYINPQENPIYQEFYAAKKPNHKIFAAELQHFASLPTVQLEFEPGCNFHQQIIFTRSCSERLIAAGALLNSTFLAEQANLTHQNNRLFC